MTTESRSTAERDVPTSGDERPAHTLGVLGGMGPLATAHFFERLVRATPASTDQEHIPTVVWSDGRVPDRSAALQGRGPSPLPMLVRGATTLAAAGADVIAVPCNTAHAFLPILQHSTRVPFVDMVAVTVAAAVREHPGVQQLGVLGTTGTRIARLYETAAAAAGLTVVQLPWDLQGGLIEEAIRIVKRGGHRDLAARLVAQAVAALASQGAECWVAACTELPLVTDEGALALPVVDSVDCLAQAVVQYCRPQPEAPPTRSGARRVATEPEGEPPASADVPPRPLRRDLLHQPLDGPR